MLWWHKYMVWFVIYIYHFAHSYIERGFYDDGTDTLSTTTAGSKAQSSLTSSSSGSMSDGSVSRGSRTLLGMNPCLPLAFLTFHHFLESSSNCGRRRSHVSRRASSTSHVLHWASVPKLCRPVTHRWRYFWPRRGQNPILGFHCHYQAKKVIQL